jgi:1-deoxy-D-xylulose-5-phosphate reductoisomerase
MRNVVLLGSTGSIGTSTLKVAEDLPDQIRLVGLAAGRNARLLLEQSRKHLPAAISITAPAKARELRKALGPATEVFSGAAGLVKLATLPEADIVLIAIVGTAGLHPALAAIRAGKDLAVASKEVLVMAGEIVMSEARKHGVRVLAVDSEHSAIFQCLEGKPAGSIRRLWLTASGGPFAIAPGSFRVMSEDALPGARPKKGWRLASAIPSIFHPLYPWIFKSLTSRIPGLLHGDGHFIHPDHHWRPGKGERK